MKIVAAIKVVPDDEAIKVAGDRSLDASKAKEKISTYDLNAIEAGAQLAAATGGSLVAISASYEGATSKKVQKDILARGPQELFAYGDAKLATADSLATAKALQALLAQVGEYDLVLCGDGDQRKACEKLAEKWSLQDRILFPGHVAEMGPWYRMADACAASSRSEGLPFNIVEAMHVGLPVIASAVKGHTDLIQNGDTGLLYPYGDAGACADLSPVRGPTQ